MASQPAEPFCTVEQQMLAKLKQKLGGLRGAVESAIPVVLFSLSYVLTGKLHGSLLFAASLGVLVLLVRLLQRSLVRFILNGLPNPSACG